MPDAKRLTGNLVRLRPEGYAFAHVRDQGDFYVNIKEMRDRSAWEEGTLVSFVPGAARKPGQAPPAYDVVKVS